MAALTGCHTPDDENLLGDAVHGCSASLHRRRMCPRLRPSEIVCSEKYTNGITRSGLPGNGLAQHPMLYVGENCNKMFLVNDGKVIWTYSTGTRPRIRRCLDAFQRQHSFQPHGIYCRNHAGQKSGVALRLPRSRRHQSHGNPRLPAHWIGQSHVRRKRPAAQVEGHQYQDRRCRGRS